MQWSTPDRGRCARGALALVTAVKKVETEPSLLTQDRRRSARGAPAGTSARCGAALVRRHAVLVRSLGALRGQVRCHARMADARVVLADSLVCTSVRILGEIPRGEGLRQRLCSAGAALLAPPGPGPLRVFDTKLTTCVAAIVVQGGGARGKGLCGRAGPMERRPGRAPAPFAPPDPGIASEVTATRSDKADRTPACACCAALFRCESGSSHTLLHSRNNAAAPAAKMIAEFNGLPCATTCNTSA